MVADCRRHRAEPDDRFLVVDRAAASANRSELFEKLLDAGDRVGCLRLEFLSPEQRPHLSVWKAGEQGLAHRRHVRWHARAHVHLQADRPLAGRDSLQVDDVGAIKLGEAHAPAEVAPQPLHMRQRPLTQIETRQVSESQVEDAHAQSIAARLLVLHEPAVTHQDSRQSMAGGLVEAGVLGELGQTHAATWRPGDDRQQEKSSRQRARRSLVFKRHARCLDR